MLNRELIFQMLSNRQWNDIAEMLYQNSQQISSDPIARQAIQIFESEFFKDIESLSVVEKLRSLKHPSLIIEIKKDSFSTGFVERLIDEKLSALRETGDDNLM